MKKFMKLFPVLLFALLFSSNAFADKVFGSGVTITSPKTYKDAGLVSRIQNPSFRLNSALGMNSNIETVNVYGVNPSISDVTPDIWDGDGIHNYSADNSADILSIASSNAGDTGVITIYGLDSTGDAVTRTPTLTGTTRVAIVGLWRVLDVVNDTSTDTIGNVFVYTGTSTVPSLGDTEVRAVILAGNNKTYMALSTIPNDKVGVLVKHEAGLTSQDGNDSLDTMLYIRKFGKSFNLVPGSKSNLAAPNNTSYQNTKVLPFVIPGLSDIRYSVNDSSTDAAGVSAGFELLIFDEDFIDTTTLGLIGQPGF